MTADKSASMTAADEPTGKSTAHNNTRNKKRNSARARRRAATRSANSLKIIQQNVAGLKSRETELFKRLEFMKVDVAVIQECNFTVTEDSVSKKIHHNIPEFRGWNVVASPRTRGRQEGSHSKGKGGVAILLREGINYEVIKERPVPLHDDTTEYCGVRIFPDDSKAQAIDVHNIYVPPINESNAEDDRVQRWNTSNLPTSPNSFIFSDTNCHGSWDSRARSSPMSDDWDEWMNNNNFTALNTPDSYTRKSTKGVLTSPDATLVHSQWLGRTSWSPLTKRPGGSDHIPLLINIRLNRYTSKKEPKRSNKKRNQKTKWAFKKAKWDEYRAMVDEHISLWPDEMVDAQSVDKLNSALTYAFIKSAEKCIPRGLRTKVKAFWDDELEKLAKESDEARARCQESTEKANEYITARDQFTKACSDAKTASWRSFVEGIDSKTDPSKVWNVIGGLDGRKTKSRPGVELRVEESDEKAARTNKEKARLFVQTYIKASTHEDTLKGREKKIHEKPVIHKMREATKTCKECKGGKSGLCSPLTLDELELALRKIKTGKAAGIDLVSNEMLKQLSPLAKEKLLTLFNKSWIKGICPGKWRLGEIIPFPKPGKDAQLTSSYRPICLLSTIGKLMERIIKCRMEWQLEKDGVLDPSQAGFRKCRSTVEQVGRLTQTIYDGFEDGLKTLVVYVDFSRAYDKVWKNKLLAKMGEIGLPGCYTKWVQSLLADRNAYVNWNGTKSNKRRFDNGVPQGSVISPLLWLIYINDLISSMPAEVQLGISSSLFADDLALVCKGEDLKECEEKMQKALDCLESWAKENKMDISIRSDEKSKTVSCFYTKNFRSESKNKATPVLKLNGINIFHSLVPKFLGVTVDQGLTFSCHTDEKSKKMKQRNGILRALAGRTWGQDSANLRSVHTTYTQPVGLYSIGAWGPFTSKSNMNKLEVRQNEAARIITGCCMDTNVEHLLCEAGLMPITLLGEQETAIMHERNMRLPTNVPARIVAEESVKKSRLKKKGADGNIIKPPREKANQILRDMGMENVARDQVLIYSSVEPWNWKCARITLNTNLEGCLGKHDTITNIHAAVAEILSKISVSDVVSYTDGSVGENNACGGAGAVTTWPDGEITTIRAACGSKCGSYRAELTALERTTSDILKRAPTFTEEFTTWIFTDSESAVKRLEAGPGAQTDTIADNIWLNLNALAKYCEVNIQWIPGHRDIEGNEAADEAAKEAAQLNQQDVAVDFNTMKSTIKRHFRKKWSAAVLAREGIYSAANVHKPPAQLTNVTRKEEVIIHQLRTGASPLVRSHWARYAQRPEAERLCPNGCNVKEDVLHVFWSCPYYSGPRMKHFGSTDPEPDILFGHAKPILKFLEEIGHSTAPSAPDDDVDVAAE